MPRVSFVTRALEEVPGFAQNYELFSDFLTINYPSSGTVDDYMRGLCRVMLAFKRLPEQITIPEFVKFYRSLKEEGLSFSTYKIIRAAVMAYFAFINVPAPAAAVPRWHKPKRIVEVLNRTELDAFLRSTGDDYMAKAIISVLVGSGPRKFELLNLRISDLDFERGRIHIHSGKGDKDRFVPFDEVLQKVVRRHMETSHPTEYLFESAPGKKLKACTVEKVVKDAVEAAGIKKHVTVHSLRHLFCSLLAEENVPIYVIQAYMGHKRLETTVGYLHDLRIEGRYSYEGPLGLIYGKGSASAR